MTAPVGNSIELDAVGELHLVLFVKPTALLGPLGFASSVVGCSLFLAIESFCCYCFCCCFIAGVGVLKQLEFLRYGSGSGSVGGRLHNKLKLLSAAKVHVVCPCPPSPVQKVWRWFKLSAGDGLFRCTCVSARGGNPRIVQRRNGGRFCLKGMDLLF